MKALSLITILCLTVAACKNHEDGSVSTQRFVPAVVKADVPAAEVSMAAPDNEVAEKVSANVGYDKPEPTQNVQDTAKKITRSGDIHFKTNNLSKTHNAVLAALRKAGGYLAEEREFFNEEDSTKNYTLQTRIPAKNFDSFLNNVSATATQVDSRNITTSDVTREYIDMSTRLRNMHLLEARYLALLNKATRMSDVLEVENKLNETRTQLESTQGQLNYLNRQISYSSLEISFYIKTLKPGGDAVKQPNVVWSSLVQGWQLLLHLCLLFISMWPVLLITVLLIVIVKRWRTKRRLARG